MSKVVDDVCRSVGLAKFATPAFVWMAGPTAWQAVYAHAFTAARQAMLAQCVRWHEPNAS